MNEGLVKFLEIKMEKKILTTSGNPKSKQALIFNLFYITKEKLYFFINWKPAFFGITNLMW